MRNPNVDILFHPTGRSMPKRDEYNVDIDAEMAEIAKNELKFNSTVESLNRKLNRITLSIKGRS